MIRLTEAALRDICDPATYQRGRAYLIDGAVDEWAAEPLAGGGWEIVGRVRGASLYRVSLAVDKVGVPGKYKCSCPYVWGGACKHVVALALAFIVRKQTDGASDAALANTESPLLPRILTGESASIAGVLESALREKGVHFDAKTLDALARRLGAVVPKPGRMRRDGESHETYRFDGITLRVTYDATTDALTVLGTVTYGPVTVLLGDQRQPNDGETTDAKGKTTTYEIDRDLDEEAACVRMMERDLFTRVVGGRLAVHGDDLYSFLKDTLPDLRAAYDVEIDPSAAHMVDVDTRSVESNWSVGSSGVDLLKFSVDWHCGKTKLTTDELRLLVNGWKPYLRDADGRFVDLDNREEIERMLAFVEREKKDGKGRVAAFFRVPELLHLIRSSKAAHMDAADSRVRALMEDTRTGKTLAPVAVPKGVADVLRPYQVRGIEWGMFLRTYRFGGILADDMGLGKTLQALTLIAMQGKDSGKPSLVVCPKTLVGVWVQEAAKFFPRLNVVAVEGTPEERAMALDRATVADVVVVSYPALIREMKTLASFKGGFAYCVADEAQYLKNSATATAAAIKTMTAEHRLALTGTPIENGVHELWSIFDFLMPGFLGERKDFRMKFELPIQKKQDAAAMERLKAMTLPFMLRRTKETELSELPPKIEQTRPCPLTAEQLTIYTHTLEEVKKEVFDAVEQKGFARSRIVILAALMRLRRVCDHPALVDPRLSRGMDVSGKMQHAIELVREAVAGGHKVLLFSQFTTMLDILREALNKEGIGHVTIEGKTKKRAEAVKAFTEDPETKVFLLSLKAGGTGLTLTAADTVILYDPWWNPMVERQAMDRAHRIGQEKTVSVYKMVTQGTIEERILLLQDRKKKVFDALVTENAGELEALTWEDVRGLFE